LLAFIILIMGGALISVKHTRFYVFKEVSEKFRKIFGDTLGGFYVELRPTRRLIFNSLFSALLFASYYVLMKYVYSSQPFIGAFVWSRFGSFIGVLLILFVPDWRREIVEQQKGNKSPKKLAFFFSVRLLAALAFIMLNWAISMGSVALVNALQGVQYIFLLVIVFILSTRFPKLFREEMGGGVMMQKIIGALLVCTGLYMLIS